MIAAVVLAAGRSARMGRAKLLLDLSGKPVVARSVELALAGGADEAVVVVGPDGDRIRTALEGLRVRFIVNPRPEEGQGSSISHGVAGLGPGVAAALILLGDQPAIPSHVIPALIETFWRAGTPIVASVYRGVQGNPVLFGAAAFPELLALTGDRGARRVVEKDPGRVTRVPFDCPMPLDIDTEEDYKRACASLYNAG
jgi:molybdenum cofactor cytidylyltransferase